MVRENESTGTNGNTSTDSTLGAALNQAGLARDRATVGVADAVNSGMEAARGAKAVIDEKLEGLIDSGRDVIDQAEDLIRSRPWASFGAAFAAGYLIAKVTRSSKD